MPDCREAYKERRDQFHRQLMDEYTQRFPASRAFHERAVTRLVDGGSHALRMFPPFPYWVDKAEGAYVYDLDGHVLLDFWQGHFAR